MRDRNGRSGAAVVSLGAAANIAVLGVVACTSFLAGSLTHWSLGDARGSGRQRPARAGAERDLHGLLEPTANAAAPGDDQAARDGLVAEMDAAEARLRREYFGFTPSAGPDEHSSSTYDPLSVSRANASRWFDWALHPPPSAPFDPTEPGALNVSYESCVASLEGRSAAKTLQRRMHWLHFPKCGTSFGAVMYGYVCQYEESPATAPPGAVNPGADCNYCGRRGKNSNKPTLWDPHLRRVIPFVDRRDGTPGMKHCDWSVPVPHFPFANHFAHAWDWGRRGGYNDAPVALFRDPRRRAASAWNNNKHSFGVGTFFNPVNRTEARRRINALRNVFEFARHPSIQSCQTKMLLGEYCGEHLNITQDMMHEALRRVLNLEFVGLTDAFNASVCLWHHQFGGTPREWMFQSVGRVRSGAFMYEQEQKAKQRSEPEPEPLPGGGERAHPSVWKEIPVEYDPLDRQVFELAKTVFVARLQKHGLWHPNYRAMKVICRGKRGPSPPC